jgi:ABC transport system ATP-binding/permease protein
MPLVSVKGLSLGFGAVPLLDSADLSIEPGERIGLLGRNGSGKSTFMKLVAGLIEPDSGSVVFANGLRVAFLPQEVPDDLPGTIYSVVASAESEDVALLEEYHDLTAAISRDHNETLITRLEEVQHLIESSGSWLYHQRVENIIRQLSLDGTAPFRFQSAGVKRRVFLARGLARNPALLLLDEPTNHLDLANILWLEDFLTRYDGTLMFVTHDRAFLKRLATRIVEIDRGRFTSFDCDYETYLKRRDALLEEEQKQWHEFDKKLAKEEVWIRQGIRARRTRNEGRVRALEKMRRERALRQEQTGISRIEVQEAERSGRIVVETKNVSFSWGAIPIVRSFSTIILRGDKVGIIGSNGVGKTTLLRILLGELQPDEGSVRAGAGLKVAYFDQLRGQLDEEKTLKENLAGGNDKVMVGDRAQHVIGYLQNFLFSPDRILSPVKTLSGGERNRLLLAKLFACPSNILVMDEPTNDLDAESLDLLEERLVDYGGTLIVVSHDREFLNNVVTSTIVFEGEGHVAEYVGGYDDWLMQKQNSPLPAKEREEQKPKTERTIREKRKLSFKEARELEELPGTIESLEDEKKQLQKTLNSPELYASRDLEKVYATNDRLGVVEQDLDKAYRRWDELESLSASLSGSPG